MLLVLALIGVMAGIVAGNAGAFIGGSNFEPRSSAQACGFGCRISPGSKRATYLQYLEANATFLVADREGNLGYP